MATATRKCGSCKWHRHGDGLTKGACMFVLPVWMYDYIKEHQKEIEPLGLAHRDGSEDAIFCGCFEKVE